MFYWHSLSENAEVLPDGAIHDDVIKWKYFPRYWPFVRGIHRSPVNSTHKGKWRGALMFTLICARINGWVNNREAGDLRRHRAHYDVIVMRRRVGADHQTIRFNVEIVKYRYNTVNFLQSIHTRYTTARPWRRNIGLLFENVIYVFSH